MPSRGSGLAVAVARTTLSPSRTTAAPPACLANFPVSNEICLPPARFTVTLLASGFIFYPYCVNQEGAGECAGKVAAMGERFRCRIGIRLRDCARCDLAQCCNRLRGRRISLGYVDGKCLLRSSLFSRSQVWTLTRIPLLAKNARNGAPPFP